MSTFSFAALFDSTDGGSTEHWGHIKCRCGHHANESLQEARTAGRIHLNGRCKWSCCGANWDDMYCTAGISKVSKSSTNLDVEEPKEEEKKEEERKDQFRRFLPTFYSQELICLSCFKPYTDPLKLSCGHSLCSECLKKIVAYQKAAGSFSSRFRANPVKSATEEVAAPFENPVMDAAMPSH